MEASDGASVRAGLLLPEEGTPDGEGIMKSGDFQVDGAICDESIVSTMRMGYEGCCFRGESIETQRQGHGVVVYCYDYGDATSAKLKWASRRSYLATQEY